MTKKNCTALPIHLHVYTIYGAPHLTLTHLLIFTHTHTQVAQRGSEAICHRSQDRDYRCGYPNHWSQQLGEDPAPDAGQGAAQTAAEQGQGRSPAEDGGRIGNDSGSVASGESHLENLSHTHTLSLSLSAVGESSEVRCCSEDSER